LGGLTANAKANATSLKAIHSLKLTTYRAHNEQKLMFVHI